MVKDPSGSSSRSLRALGTSSLAAGDGIPSPEGISIMLKSYKDEVEVYSTDYKYALNERTYEELLFIAS